ncbi:FtsW/RodA/SpoVE family cell cycle protein [Specibacter cremeus]|uniref:FtsW/RodA/SpoVE family cell cycle protein n=1 Tax=Specibacter cremeus TaxID=1629051 RepID=UPI000F7A9A9E|nr:FtsW/RodA/SpoVE family cell cycle protein [Specibacter cremeus]
MSQLLTVNKPRRTAELGLLLVALAVGIMANALVYINMARRFDTDFYSQSAILAVLSLAMHICVRLRAKYADPIILPVAVALNGIGLAVIHRLDLGSATGDNAGPRQWLWTSLAVIVAIAVLWFLKDHRVLRRYTYISLMASVLLLLMPLVPGISAGDVNGATVWIRLGPFTFQPGEIAKLTLAVFFAGYLSSNRDLILLAGKKIGPLQLPRTRDLGPMVVAWLASVGVLVFQHDLGTSVLFFGLFMVMIYVATSRISWVIIGLLLMVVGGAAAISIFPHVNKRVDVWLHAFDPQYIAAGGYQVVQGLFGMANGGLMGTGLGNGRPNIVPLANSDMIVASIGEELGMIGLFAVVCLYGLFFSRAFRASLGARDAFGKLLAAGLAFGFALQCFIIIGGVTRLIPLTGLTTPFLAAGGSSLLANWILVALILRISDAARRPIDTTTPKEPEEVTAA